ncbi:MULTISPECIES: serine/threonine-protein kinase [Sorangium]|uniref:Protein kinase n=1 Tax=Sorangium cellulosum (strain So ce56) TaxID=448385 RepID=A9EUI2_SORC5|nr:serine/threonine-protein kinase [Sorangium cellulosum]CAN91101.1 Protein kinase [Sorangium cellulosum So ce56]
MIDPSSPSHQLVGAVLNGRFRILRLLGEGGMGAVYEAEGLRGEGKRAIKVLHPEFTQEEQVLHRFFAEAEATRGFVHQNIASVFEATRAEDGTPYLVMELLQGVPLAAYIDTGNPIPPQQAVPIIHEVLQALMAAHSHKVIHRDLKPENLFLIRDPRGGFRVKVLDFGIAKVMDAAGGMGLKTRAGTLLGTPGYMSPEQIKNAQGVDARADLWSVGVIFYEMLTATQPFPAENEFARLTAVLAKEVRPIEQVAPHLAAWGLFFQRALCKDVAGRFQTAEEMAQTLGAIAHRTGIATPSARPDAPASPALTHQLPSLPPPQPLQSVTQPPQNVAQPPQNVTQPVQSVPPVASRVPTVPPPRMTAPPAQASPSVAPTATFSARPTHISAQQPAGVPTLTGGHYDVRVVEVPLAAEGGGSEGAAWWLVGLIGLVCLGVGFALGVLVSG